MYNNGKMIFWRAFNFVLLLAGSLFMIAPLFWMISTSMKTKEEIYRGDFTFNPEYIKYSKFTDIFTVAPSGTYFIKKAVITVIVVLANVFVNAYIAYRFAKIEFKGRGPHFILVLSTMM